MKALVQRVTEASVTIDGEKVAEIGTGYLVLFGVTHTDTEADAARLASRVNLFANINLSFCRRAIID